MQPYVKNDEDCIYRKWRRDSFSIHVFVDYESVTLKVPRYLVQSKMFNLSYSFPHLIFSIQLRVKDRNTFSVTKTA
jgi:hypothetical protein